MTPSEYGGLFNPPLEHHLNHIHVSGLWRVTTLFSGILLLVGYLLLAVVFDNSDANTHINHTPAVVAALFFIALANVSSFGIAFFQRHQPLFLLRSLFMPFVIINLIALFNFLLNVFARDLFPLSALRVIAIGLTSAFALVHGGIAILIYHEYEYDGSPRTNRGTPLLSDEEMQRRQLARLLGDRSAGAPSPDIVNSTYRLEIPTLEPIQKAWAGELSLPPTSRFPSDPEPHWSRVNQSII
ncbi:hypothetical protein N7466_010367 [Penicillium verhagenii]|uniref:uncharacterized protein n=1 Tax=Penicillium verhagenii TaxID=1562060 RepID=UPI002544EEDC|nr:uncharacterized protein N7466_010367 [Penicillium verhagenii]KAJ5919424.1 hypothetical protein N7466_010367 [Penicillium verhagenii]